jgi:hypothetical protein
VSGLRRLDRVHTEPAGLGGGARERFNVQGHEIGQIVYGFRSEIAQSLSKIIDSGKPASGRERVNNDRFPATISMLNNL